MSFRAVCWMLAMMLCLGACSDRKATVIQPGAFTEEWPTALRKELIEDKRCVIDSINGQSLQHALTFKSGEPLTFSGWIFSKTDGASPEVYVQLVGPVLTYTAVTQKRIARPDLNQAFSIPLNWNAGFELQATQTAEPGEYRLEVLQVGAHGITQCKAKATIKIDSAVNAG